MINEQENVQPSANSMTITNVVVADELKKLKDLLDSNILTEEEYNIQKERLLK